MIERLLIPAWNAPPRSIADWQSRLEALGLSPSTAQDGPDETWIVLGPIGTRLLAVVEGANLTALHAEIDAPNPSSALELLEQAARDLAWEVHDVEEDEDEND